MSIYHQILLTKLKNLSDYEYFGGYTCKKNIEKNNYMKSLELLEGTIFPDIKKECECTHWIKQNCYVRNIKTKDILVIGACCIKHFKITKKCSLCNNEHKRTKSNICIDCDKQLKKKDKLKTTTLNFGKYKGYSIGYVEEKDYKYLKYIYDKFDANNNDYKKTNSKKIYEYLNLNLIVTVSSDTR